MQALVRNLLFTLVKRRRDARCVIWVIRIFEVNGSVEKGRPLASVSDNSNGILLVLAGFFLKQTFVWEITESNIC